MNHAKICGLSAEEMQRELFLTKADMRPGGRQTSKGQSFGGRITEHSPQVNSGNIITLALYRASRLHDRD
jgi:hypothetical protein